MHDNKKISHDLFVCYDNFSLNHAVVGGGGLVWISSDNNEGCINCKLTQSIQSKLSDVLGFAQ